MKALEILLKLDEYFEESKDYDFKYDSESHEMVI